MAECRRCGREHAVPRRFATTELWPACHPGIYVTQPEVWPGYLAWLRENYAAMLGPMTDGQVQDAVRHGIQLMTDLVFQSLPGFMVLRNVGLGAAKIQLTVASQESPCTAGVTLLDDDGAAAASAWVLTREDAESLAALFRERIGDPDGEIIADCAGTERMAELVQGNSVVFLPGHEHGQ